jgi:hypothetical protein
MTKTRNNKLKKNKSSKAHTSGGNDLEQKYSLASIDEGNEIGGFKHSNTIFGFLGITSLLYYVYYRQNIYT